MRSWTFALVLFAVGAAAAWTATRSPLPALSPDSASYLGAAESFARGDGLRVPMTKWWSKSDTEPLRHFPPGFPFLIALPTFLGVEAVQAARAIQAAAAGLTLTLSALTVAAASGSPLGGVLAAAALLATSSIAQNFIPVLSEPLFLSLVALLVYLLTQARQQPLLLGFVAAAAALVRYAGISLTGTCVLCCLMAPGTALVRARRAALAALPTLVALGGWQRASGNFRKYGVSTEGLWTEISRAGATLAASMVPALPGGALHTAIACLAAALAAFVVGAAFRMDPAAQPSVARFRSLLTTAALFSTCYAAVVVAARCFADPGIEFDWRTLCPVIMLGEVVCVAALALRFRVGRNARRTTYVLASALWMLGSSLDLARLFAKTQRLGYGYEAESWQRSEVAAWLRAQRSDLAIFTNNPAAYWHLTRRPSHLMPMTHDVATLRDFTHVFKSRPSAMVEFPNALDPTVDPRLLAAQLGCGPPLRFDRGDVWLPTPE